MRLSDVAGRPSRRIVTATAQLVTGLLMVALLALPSPSVASSQSLPDVPTFDTSIVNGIGPIEQPAVVALMRVTERDPFQAQFCTATLIAPTAALTAAHCVYRVHLNEIDVFVGAADLYSTEGRRISVARIDVHPRWREQGDDDVAVVHLSRAADQPTMPMLPPVWNMGRSVPPQPGDYAVGAFAAGWGCEELNAVDRSCLYYPTHLQGARVELVPQELCDYFGELVLERSGLNGLICAGDVSESGLEPDTCQADSGGPLSIAGARGFPLLVGVTSWGVSCGYFPGVYTHVSAHHGWIIRQLATSPASQQPSTFTDVDSSNPHAPGVAFVAAAGIATGYSDGTFQPGRTLTRGQMAAFLARSLHLPTGQWFDGPYGGTDVQRGDSHAEAVAGVVRSAVATGYNDGTFRPSEIVTRGQMATFLTRAFQLEASAMPLPEDVAPTSTHAAGIAAVLKAGVATGYEDGTFRSEDPVTRAQMATFLTRALLTIPI